MALGSFSKRRAPLPCTALDEPDSLKGKMRVVAYRPVIAIVNHLCDSIQARVNAFISSTEMYAGATTGNLSEPGQTASLV